VKEWGPLIQTFHIVAKEAGTTIDYITNNWSRDLFDYFLWYLNYRNKKEQEAAEIAQKKGQQNE